MELFTALGAMAEWARLFMCSLSASINWGSAVQIFASESDKTSMLAWPILVVTCMMIVGAGCMDPFAMLESLTSGNSLGDAAAQSFCL